MKLQENNTLYLRAESCPEKKNYDFITEVIFSLFSPQEYSFIIDHHYLSWFSRKQAQKLAEELKAEYLLYRKSIFRYSGSPSNSFSMEIKTANDLTIILQTFGKNIDDLYLRILKKTSDRTLRFDKCFEEGEEKYKELLNRKAEYQAVAFISCQPLDIIIHSNQMNFENGVDIAQRIVEQVDINLDENKVFD